ncbi:MAG: hydantoinase B/oxoprolinase family protein [Chloroflexi bacterium]|nr:hydantoinase B/oxoprolinase family protein [Chloroflexota bacterium]
MEYDPITLEILWGRLNTIADESATALQRTSFSTIVRESNDLAADVLDPDGNIIAECSVGVPSFIGTMPGTLRYMLQQYPFESLEPGDVLVTNDPWEGTGHLPDFTVCTPVFYQGSIVAWIGTVAHSADTGGRIFGVDAREIYEEGLWLPPLKLHRRGEPNDDVYRIIRQNVRVPEQVIGDLRAQVLANEVGARKVVELLEEERMPDLKALSGAIYERSEAAMRAVIAKLPDGEYRSEVRCDSPSSATADAQPLKDLTVRCAVRISGSDLECDFTGTDPVVPFATNASGNYIYSYTLYGLKAALNAKVPGNYGMAKPFTITNPVGSFLHAPRGHAVGARHLVGHFSVHAAQKALAQVIPDRVLAESSLVGMLVLFGTDSDGKRWGNVPFFAGGMGATQERDGLSCMPFPTNTSLVATEIVEQLVPMKVEHKRYVVDSAGPGRRRGGLGQEVALRSLSEHPVQISVLLQKSKNPPQGLDGAGAGMGSTSSNSTRDWTPTMGMTELAPGGTLSFRTAGGGGFGDPFRREPELVAADVRNRKISAAAARSDYGVALDEAGNVDMAETAKLRGRAED